MFSKYVGCRINIIYMDQDGEFTQRTVDVRSVKNGRAHVYCHKARAPRILIVGNIMAVERVKEGA